MTTQTEALKLALEALGAYMSATDSEEDAKAHSLMAEAFFKIKEALSSPNGEAQPDQYAKGYADAMNWKTANHLEHLPVAQPEQTNTRPYYTIDELNAWADEKEKQAWRNAAIRVGEELSSVGPDGYYDMNAWQWLDWAMENVQKAQPEQEPVAWMHTKIEGVAVPHRPADLDKHPDRWTPLYKEPKPCPTCEALARTVMLDQTSHDTTPPQRTWVGLTDEEIEMIVENKRAAHWEFVRQVESILKEKNT